MEIIPLGDSALIVRVRDQFEDAPEETLNEVLSTFQHLRNAAIPGIIEVAPAYTSVAIFYDPLQVSNASSQADRGFDWLTDQVRHVVAAGTDRGKRRTMKKSGIRSLEIPVCYHPEFGPDLDDVARHAQISIKEVVELHTGADYRVACIGFVPGFTFMAGLPKKLATPRRDTPRKEIPPGAIGIGGAQTGIYPSRSPGGWNLIGRTPLKLFDPVKDPPTLLCAGDRVRFRAIAREEFESSMKRGHSE